VNILADTKTGEARARHSRLARADSLILDGKEGCDVARPRAGSPADDRTPRERHAAHLLQRIQRSTLRSSRSWLRVLSALQAWGGSRSRWRAVVRRRSGACRRHIAASLPSRIRESARASSRCAHEPLQSFGIGQDVRQEPMRSSADISARWSRSSSALPRMPVSGVFNS